MTRRRVLGTVAGVPFVILPYVAGDGWTNADAD
jgi:hypothetical protein